ncbi:MAG: DUF4962 domain-containing protein [Muribaculaceae bacterium]|nr:DUF4962 domain-containing protein [Muribaculaceae bacterium]
MKKNFIILFAIIIMSALGAKAGANLQINDVCLMHESRDTPFPADGSVLDDRKISFQWPLPVEARGTGAPLDGFEHTVKKVDKSKLKYRLRYSQDKTFKTGTTIVETIWPMYNPDKDLKNGVWYWQYSYVDKNGNDTWSPVYNVTIADNGNKFCPPSYAEFKSKVPATHPRVLVDAAEWDKFIAASKGKQDAVWYIEEADKAMAVPMKRIEDIRTDNLGNLTNEMQRNSYLTRESRRIIDAEEKSCTALIYAYLLTKNRKYADEAVKRITTMCAWSQNENVKGDFNDGTMLSLASLAYDSFFNLLSDSQKKILLDEIKDKGTKMYARFNNNVENHIAENHIWQMTMRITAMAAIATLGELPEADLWTDYCYNLWLARFPGLNKDGGWHNGDSYFTVNTKTLVDLPYLYGRITGFDFFSDPWYDGNIMYMMFQQPPFSKSGGNGSGHQNVARPNAARIGQLDAMARLKNNSFAADFVRRTLKADSLYLKKAVLAKPSDLGWFRLLCDKPLPQGPGLPELPHGYVLPQTGLASWCTNWDRVGGNAMWSFRSSPYGSTSHALANQNAFNTFYGGKPLFYSAGHHIEFTDKHSMICHRGTLGHNTILANGCGQKIGVEGYGWIPRYYMSDRLGYVLGDASNAYGPVISPLWLQRGEQSDVQYIPENGWDTENHVKKFRRHIVTLGNTGCIFIYDELEADKPVTWTFQLHTVTNPMELNTSSDKFVHVTATGKGGASDAWIFSSGAVDADTTSVFREPAVNWLRADEKGNFKPFANHWHFNATSKAAQTYRFATCVNTHALKHPAKDPEILSDGRIKFAGYLISVNLSESGAPSFYIRSTKEDVNISYKGQETVINEVGYRTTLEDVLPELEI